MSVFLLFSVLARYCNFYMFLFSFKLECMWIALRVQLSTTGQCFHTNGKYWRNAALSNLIPRSCCSSPLGYNLILSTAFILTEIFQSSVFLFFSLTPCITMSFIYFAHIKARRNPESIFFSIPCSPLRLLSLFPQLHTVWPVSLRYRGWGALIESRDGSRALKY